MLEFFLLAQLEIQFDYRHLTTENKARVEQAVYESRRNFSGDPQITPNEISNILRLEPICYKTRPPSSQIRCEWIEGKRTITGFWSFLPDTEWKFQRWTAEGDWYD